LCLIAVKGCGEALQFVPEALKTKDMCLAALNKTASALRFVPKILSRQLVKAFTIRLTNNEIKVINAFVKGSIEPFEMNELMHGKIIHKSAKFNRKIVWTNKRTYITSIGHIWFSENNKEAHFIKWISHGFDALGYTVKFIKKNGKWIRL
jgi:hypothetical protein